MSPYKLVARNIVQRVETHVPPKGGKHQRIGTSNVCGTPECAFLFWIRAVQFKLRLNVNLSSINTARKTLQHESGYECAHIVTFILSLSSFLGIDYSGVSEITHTYTDTPGAWVGCFLFCSGFGISRLISSRLTLDRGPFSQSSSHCFFAHFPFVQDTFVASFFLSRSALISSLRCTVFSSLFLTFLFSYLCPAFFSFCAIFWHIRRLLFFSFLQLRSTY